MEALVSVEESLEKHVLIRLNKAFTPGQFNQMVCMSGMG